VLAVATVDEAFAGAFQVPRAPEGNVIGPGGVPARPELPAARLGQGLRGPSADRRRHGQGQDAVAGGWGFGALVALPLNDQPELFEFDPNQFHPERRGDADDGGRDRTSRIVSMGSGQSIADPFLGFVRLVFWKDDKPKVRDAR
jgi:hypothetical protein